MKDQALARAIEDRFGSVIPLAIDVVRELKTSHAQAERVLEQVAPELPSVRKAVLPLPTLPILTWTGCYAKSWKGFVHEDSFKHPAKFSRCLIEKVLRHGIEQGYWKPAETTIGDPFGGVGLGGVVATYMGFQWVGLELEPKFVATAKLNFEMHAKTWDRYPGTARPTILQGDSRNFDTAIQAALTSPPYAGTRLAEPTNDQTNNLRRKNYDEVYGDTDGQIDKLPPGSIDAAVTSPPYDTIHAGSGGLNHLPAKEDGQQSGRAAGASQTEVDNRYGDEEGQIGKLAKGELAAVVTSPPYADTMSPAAGGADTQHPDGCNRAMQGRKDRYGAEDGQIGAIGTPGTVEGAATSPPWEAGATGHVGADKFADPAKYAEGMKESGRCSAEARLAQFERDKEKSYGDSQGQIGTLKKETYWQAMRQVYEALFRSLKPGGYAAIVVKDFVRKKKRVQLCDDTLRLLCFVGFDGVERIHAMLVEPLPTHGATDMLGMPTGESASVQKKSFFRRLHESKPGAVKIDYEEVIIVQKPYE